MIKVHKAKIPSHLSFALKTSMLEMALQEIGANCPVELFFMEPESTGALFEAQYHPADKHCQENHLRVLAGAVPSASRKEMTALLQENVLLEFMVWLEALLQKATSSNPRQDTPTFHTTYVGGKLHITQVP